ncbi:MAG: amino acid permease [Planctomycetes bacterium]|nr:amino acid permease [Planctomycetota bacterium]
MDLFRTKSIEELRERADAGEHKLHRTLGRKDLIFLGIGAIIGAGIFSTLGTAAAGEAGVRAGAGPALVISFILLGLVCGLAGLCYAELTSMIPVSGSAYTYAFATMGELIAWIIGWDLILEYAVGNVAVAIAWSGYFQSVIGYFGVELPFWLSHGYGDVMQQLSAATHAVDADKIASLQGALDAAPHLFGRALMINLPATLIVLAITWLLVRGVKESARVNNWMVYVKLLVLAMFLVVGAFYVDPENWKPFAPNGWRGIHQGAAIVFFAYIGFDAVSTAAEECKNPQKDMPVGILAALGICTLIYVLVGLVATGLVPYAQLASGADPLARALEGAGLPIVQLVLSIGAVVSMSAVLLVFQLGQPRIFFAMSRDGLLPKVFSKVHPRYKTPHITTIATGLVVAAGAAYMDDDATYDLTNIGTLFAFLVACLGVMILRIKKPDIPRAFRVPFVWLVAPAGAAACVYTMFGLPSVAWTRFGIWLAVGVGLYFVIKIIKSRTATGSAD